MKRVWYLLVLLVIFNSCKDEDSVSDDLVAYLPSESIAVVSLTDMAQLNEFLSNNPIINAVNQLDRFQDLATVGSFLFNTPVKDEALIALSMEGKNQPVITMITYAEKSQVPDSLSTTKTITYNDIKINVREVDDNTYYQAIKDGLTITSSSQIVMESILRRNLGDFVFDGMFKDLYDRTHGNDLSFYIRSQNKSWFWDFMTNQTVELTNNSKNWYQTEVDATDSKMQLDGLVIYKDSIKQKQSLYNNLEAQENKVAQLLPVSFIKARSITYGDKAELITNLKTYHNKAAGKDGRTTAILENSNELMQLELEKGNAIAMHLKPYEELFLNLDSLSSDKTTYRDQVIYTMSEPWKTNNLLPLIDNRSYKHVIVLDEFMVWTASVETLEFIIANYQNGSTLSSLAWWQEQSKELATSSSLLEVISTQFYKDTEENLSKNDRELLDKIEAQDFPAIIHQYVHENQFATYRMVVPINNQQQLAPLVAQVGTYKSSNDIVAGPFIFPNHTNGSYDIAIQDVEYNLTLIAPDGTAYWSKQLDNQIMGDIQSVDTYKNGRRQLLFNTQNQVYLLDRNGNDVDGFPIKTRNDITQPLSLFDYDNNKNYRILLTLDDELIMYNSSGNKVNGFKYTSDGEIAESPQHFRKGSKDYIAFTTSSNKLKLLSRTGDVRTEIGQTIDNTSELYFKDNLIQTLNKNRELIKINPTTGKITTTKTVLNNDDYIEMSSRTQVRQSKNELQINDNSIELPYGTYTPARIQSINGKDFIYTVDTGENKVYIFDSKGEMVPFLPVYGKAMTTIGGLNSRFIATVDGNEVLIYSW
ncbi:hypothetical protein [Nonlabens ponticola]|uniref:Uncharacterized protein n=1 Tax=Nonlabens ponticola TaxID=2496866 RepID=A0A3S9MXG7_9FLAO|nr:hypothetical protein [Nonlabens ponticola]AZQ43829.1 hypothetical protein EJ995_06145 [Nonlabens ponticola]